MNSKEKDFAEDEWRVAIALDPRMDAQCIQTDDLVVSLPVSCSDFWLALSSPCDGMIFMLSKNPASLKNKTPD